MDKPEVYEIDINKKYLLRIPCHVHYEAARKAQEAIDEWIKSDRTILVISDVLELVKVKD